MTTSPFLPRRSFLKITFTTTGGLLIGSYLAGCATPTPTPTATATRPPNPTGTSTPPSTDTPTPTASASPPPVSSFRPNLFVELEADGTVTLIIHRSEMGQGVRTALAMILAEELDVAWASVRVRQLSANPRIGDNQVTGGSGSVSGTYQQLRDAGARAREVLVAAAAQTWGIAVADCQAEQGTVVNLINGERLSYGELISVAKTVQLTDTAPLKDPAAFRLIGTSVPRIDEPDIVTGQARYGLDVRVPGMLFATVARCPVAGGSLESFEAGAAEAVPGVRAVVQVPSGVAVVATNTWAAIRGRAALTTTWREGTNFAHSSESIQRRLALITNEAILNEAPGALTTLDAVYETPYLAHAPLEPVNCVADVRADRCEIWAPTQNPQAVQEFVEDRLGLPTVVHVTLLGGGFGRRLEVDYALEAADVSQAVGAPVQVVWTREDDLQHDFYRQPTYHWLRAGWDNVGGLSLWRHYISGPGFNGVAYRAGRELLEEGLAVPYNIANRFNRTVYVDIPLPTGPWRAVMAGPNAFANECFFDEVAAALQRDPYEFRLALLPANDPLRPVVEMAATQANWGSPLPEGFGRGLACHTYHQTAVAMVAEVSVEAGQVRVHKVTCALDCGTVIHPDMVVQQMEGSVVFGLTSLLKNEITFQQGRVQQSNFHDYALLPMGEMPEVDVHLLPATRAPLGVGEMGVPPIVPAVMNAIFAATGKRLRRMPIRAGDL